MIEGYYIKTVANCNGRIMKVEIKPPRMFDNIKVEGDNFQIPGGTVVEVESGGVFFNPIEALREGEAFLNREIEKAEKRLAKLKAIARVRIWDVAARKEVAA